MAAETAIGWCNSTFNHVRGCIEVSPACDHCYAREMAKRNPTLLGKWGTEEQGGTRVVASEDQWKEPLKWNKKAQASGQRRRVFCASMADVFESWSGYMMDHQGRVLLKPLLESENQPSNWIAEGLHFGEITLRTRNMPDWQPVTMDDVRNRLFKLIDATPWLDWLLLTKRPENIRKMWPGRHNGLGAQWVGPKDTFNGKDLVPHRPNVWLGCTVENQEQLIKRLPALLKCGDLSPVLWLSCEPLLGPLDLQYPEEINPATMCCSGFECGCRGLPTEPPLTYFLKFVIGGCESGSKARPTDIEWFRSLRDQCKDSAVPYFHKQMMVNGKLVKQLDQFPEEFRIQQFPQVK